MISQKLKAIEQLKEQAAAGKQLEKNQVRLHLPVDSSVYPTPPHECEPLFSQEKSAELTNLSGKLLVKFLLILFKFLSATLKVLSVVGEAALDHGEGVTFLRGILVESL